MTDAGGADRPLVLSVNPRSAAIAAAAIAAIGSIGPWAHADLLIASVNVNGTDGGGDGYITLALCVLAIVALARRMDVVAGALGGCSVLVGAYDFVDITQKAPLHPSWGIWAVCIGSGGVLGFAVWARGRERP